MASIELKNIVKRYGKVQTIHGVDLSIRSGEFAVFVGPSGCGKSTLLRLIAGLEEISEGDMYIGDELVNGVEPKERGIAMVFQSYALYPHMTVYDNMAFGLGLSKMPKDEVKKRVHAAADTLQLTPLLERLPKHLSGGQRQRVAIGRAIVREPKVFLFDEPLSNLDAALRVQMRIEIAKLHAELDATMVYVTHDQVEAMTLADRIVVLSEGRVEQVGAPLELYHHPQNLFVAGFIGSPKMNLMPATIIATTDSTATITLPGGGVVTAHVHGATPGPCTIGVRPEHFGIGEAGQGVEGTVVTVEQLGDESLAYLQIEGSSDLVTAALPPSTTLKRNDRVNLLPHAEQVHVFDGSGNAFKRSIDPLAAS